jgi:thymidylate synthase
MRSVDVMLGLPYDLIVYALLTEILAGEIGCTAGNLTFMMGNTHIYMNHTDKAMKLLERKPLKPSKIYLSLNATVDNFVPDMAMLPDYECHDEIKFELNL